MKLPANQDVLHDETSDRRDFWLDRAAHALFELRREEHPAICPQPWDLAPVSVRRDFRYLAMSAYRRSLPLVKEVLIENAANNYANLEGWIYPDCDNKPAPGIDERQRPVFAAQRRQLFRDKARQLVVGILQYLEVDCDTEAQRQIVVDRAEGQRKADVMIVSNWRSLKGIRGEANHG